MVAPLAEFGIRLDISPRRSRPKQKNRPKAVSCKASSSRQTGDLSRDGARPWKAAYGGEWLHEQYRLWIQAIWRRGKIFRSDFFLRRGALARTRCTMTLSLIAL